jgi:hypothetical protein
MSPPFFLTRCPVEVSLDPGCPGRTSALPGLRRLLVEGYFFFAFLAFFAFFAFFAFLAIGSSQGLMD